MHWDAIRWWRGQWIAARVCPLSDDHMLELLDWVVSGGTLSVEGLLKQRNRVVLCPGYSTPHVRKLNEKWRTRVADTPWCSCSATARRPVAGSTCSAGIFYEYRVADTHRAGANTNSSMHCSPWFDYEDAILAHSRDAGGNWQRSEFVIVSRQYASTKWQFLSNGIFV